MISQELVLVTLAAVSAILSVFSLGIGSIALFKIMSLEKSTHKIEYVAPQVNIPGMPAPTNNAQDFMSPEELNKSWEKLQKETFGGL